MRIASIQKNYNESALITRLQSGNAKAFEELYNRFSPNLLNILTSIVHDQMQAEDLLQDSFIKIWRNLHQYNSKKGRLFTWMSTIVRNCAFDYLQTFRQPHYCIDEISLERMGTVTPTYQTIDLAYWVNSSLCPNQRQMVNLVYFQGYTHQEVSDEFGVPLGSVKTYLRQALNHLRKLG